MRRRQFAAGKVVFREGDIGDTFFQIIAGTAGVYLQYGEADQRKLNALKAGQYFGEMAVIEVWPRSATVVAEEKLRVIEITEFELNAFFEEHPERILEIMKQIGERIRTLTTEYEEVTAFLKEKESAEKNEGFFAKLKKYREISALAKKNPNTYSAETQIRIREFDRPIDSPIPIMEYNKGTIIFREGDSGNYMYAVQGGAVGIYTHFGTVDEKKLTTLYSNSFFGEMSLLDQAYRSATAVAEEDGTVLEVIRPEEIEILFKSNPLEVDMILCHLSNRLRQLTLDYVKACNAAAAET